MSARLIVTCCCGLFVAGCATFEGILTGSSKSPQNGQRIVIRDNGETLRMIAERMGMRPSAAKSAEDVATDIKLVIDESTRQMPKPLAEETISRLEKLLKPEERKILRAYQQAVVDAQGRRVLYLPVSE